MYRAHIPYDAMRAETGHSHARDQVYLTHCYPLQRTGK